MAKIELSNIAHTYEPTVENPAYALKELNMVWEDGGTYALLGPSGCGKTTMLNIISGLVRPSHGQVLFDGVNFTEYSTPARNIAQVFQFPVIYTLMTVEENLDFPLKCRRVPEKERKKRVREVAELLNLSDKLKRPARKLAADEKQLISLGRGLVRSDVSALLLDEPLTVIDPQLKFDIRKKLKTINERYGLTMVYVTHDQNEAMSFADTIVVMNNGEVVQAGTPQELYEKPETTYVGYFIGSPSMNFIKCDFDGGRLHTAGGSIPLPSSVSVPEDRKNLKLGIRPRFVSFAAPGADSALKGRTEMVQEFGNYRIATVRMEEDIIRLKLPPGAEVPADDAWISFPEDKICLYANDVLVNGNR